MKPLFAALLLCLSSTPALSATDPLLDKVIAGARAVPVASIAYERSLRAVSQENGGAAENRTATDRWDGQQMTSITVNGKPATPDDVARARKAAAGRPVSGYHRIANYLREGAKRVTDPQGRTVYRIDKLPKGSVTVSGDRSADMVGEAVIDTSGAQPFVSRFRIFLPKPLSFFMVAKLDSYEVVNEYRLGPGGRPALVRQVQAMVGSQMGKAGQTRTEITYTPLR
jgi:hypothetical protein